MEKDILLLEEVVDDGKNFVDRRNLFVGVSQSFNASTSVVVCVQGIILVLVQGYSSYQTRAFVDNQFCVAIIMSSKVLSAPDE